VRETNFESSLGGPLRALLGTLLGGEDRAVRERGVRGLGRDLFDNKKENECFDCSEEEKDKRRGLPEVGGVEERVGDLGDCELGDRSVLERGVGVWGGVLWSSSLKEIKREVISQSLFFASAKIKRLCFSTKLCKVSFSNSPLIWVDRKEKDFLSI